MRKSTMFISAVLTTFMLAVMFGVASAYQKIVQTGVTPTVSAVQQVQPTDVAVANTTGPVATMTLEQAAALASSVLGRTDLYTAENSTLDGVNVYLVTFSSGDLVYVSLDGKILSISKLPVKYVLGQAVAQGGNGGGGSDNTSVSAPAAPSASSNDGGGEHSSEHSDEHEGGDD